METLNQPDPAKSSRRLIWIVGIVSILGMCACIGGCTFLFGSAIYGVAIERGNVEASVDEFMQVMVARDTDTAYDLFSSRVKRQMDASTVEEMISEANYALFDGYQSVEIHNINISTGFNTNKNLPQGQVATVDGIVTYDSEYTGQFEAVLEQEDGTWRLHNINITVPPNKMKDYLENNSLNSGYSG